MLCTEECIFKKIYGLQVLLKNIFLEFRVIFLVKYIYCQFILRYNLAINRQTKYLAYFDGKFSKCNMNSDLPAVQNELLKRAKKTLHELTYFALHEYQNLSQILFEKSIGNNLFKFEKQSNNSLVIDEQKTNAAEIRYGLKDLKPSVIRKIEKINYLDIELYEYAVKLFFKKLKYFNIDYTDYIKN